MRKTYTGHCHCGAVRFEADLDLSAGTFKCNCPMCTMTRLWGTIVTPDAFRLSAGEADLVDYQPDSIHHVFCKHCGVRSFGWGENPGLGGKFYAVRVNCLDDVDIDDLVNAPVTYFDGAHDNYDSAPAEIRHLQGSKTLTGDSSAVIHHDCQRATKGSIFAQETVEKPTHVTRELFGVDIGGATKEHPQSGL